MLTKFVLVAFLSNIKISLFLQEPALIPFRKKKKSKQKMYATTLIFSLFSLT